MTALLQHQALTPSLPPCSIKRSEQGIRNAASSAARAELLLTQQAGYLEAEAGERSARFTQSLICKNVDENTRRKQIDLKLTELGPYRHAMSRNGRYMLLGGRLGHVSSMDWQAGRLEFEINVRETVRDVVYLHNHTMVAAAQRKYVYIYDNTGAEVHCLRSHVEPNRLQFLPFHFLLASVGNAGYLKYQDVSTGQLVAELRTKYGRCDVMRHNPFNAVMCLGHGNGVCTMWSPTVSTPLVKLLCHKGPVLSLAVDDSGLYLATAGIDRQMSIWDVRTFKPLHSYIMHRPCTTLDVSQRGLLACGFGSHVEIWKDALSSKQKEPYLSHHFAGGEVVEALRFVPYEDVLGCGHSSGFSSFIVPGSGEPNFDAFEANPFESSKQRREAEVHSVLEKLQPDMIALDAQFVGKVDRAPSEVIAGDTRTWAQARNLETLTKRTSNLHQTQP